MLCGLDDCTNQAVLDGSCPTATARPLPAARVPARPQEAANHDRHIVPGKEAAHHGRPSHGRREPWHDD
jgi:hypothetical protein